MPIELVRAVTLHADPFRHNYGRRATLCESLLGILPGACVSRDVLCTCVCIDA